MIPSALEDQTSESSSDPFSQTHPGSSKAALWFGLAGQSIGLATIPERIREPVIDRGFGVSYPWFVPSLHQGRGFSAALR